MQQSIFASPVWSQYLDSPHQVPFLEFRNHLGFFPGGPVVKAPALPLHGAWVQSLVPGQGTRIPHAMRRGQK